MIKIIAVISFHAEDLSDGKELLKGEGVVDGLPELGVISVVESEESIDDDDLDDEDEEES